MNDASSEATEARRRTVLASSLTATQVAARLNEASEDAATDIDDLRRAGEIFGVWHKEAAAFVYPRFQFEPQVTAASRRQLLSVLSSLVGFVPTDVSDDARTPAEAFADEPNSVFALVNQISAA